MPGVATPTAVIEAFAINGGRNVVPVPSQIGITTGAASYNDGFPPATRIQPGVGGIPPDGLDMNGVLFDISSHAAALTAGQVYPYNAAVATAIGGYKKGALLAKADGTGFWVNLLAGNASNPDTGGANWASLLPGAVLLSPSGSALQTINGPLTVTGLITANARAGGGAGQFNGVSNQIALAVTGSTTTGQSQGQDISAGTNASDFSLRIRPANQSTTLWTFTGSGALRQNDSSSTVMGVASGNTGSAGSGVGYAFQFWAAPFNSNGIYLVSAALSISGGSTIYQSVAVVVNANGTLSLTSLVAGSALPLSIVGNSVSMYQNSGVTQAGGINWNVMRIV